MTLGLGLAYSRSSPRRSVLVVAMYTVAVFTLTLLVTIAQLYSHNVDGVARRLGGAAGLEVTSDATRPVPVRDVAQMPGVTHVTRTSAIDAQLRVGSSSTPVAVTLVGFDASFVGHGSPEIGGSAGDSVFARVAGDPSQVIVGADLHADRQSGLPGAAVHVGDRVELRDPVTGESRTARVAGVVDQARWAGADHVFAPLTVVDGLARGAVAANLLYVETAAGTNNDVVAAVIDGTHIPYGAYARSFQRLASDTLSAQRQFLDIGAGYATVGLLADLAAIGVLMIDRVRERRRQIAMLRALGLRGATVRRAFRIEAAVIALEGVVVGMGAGLVLAWRLGSTGVLGRRPRVHGAGRRARGHRRRGPARVGRVDDRAGASCRPSAAGGRAPRRRVSKTRDQLAPAAVRAVQTRNDSDRTGRTRTRPTSRSTTIGASAASGKSMSRSTRFESAGVR